MDIIYNFFSDSKIHDYEIGNIFINYLDNIIKIDFYNEKNELINICINDFKKISMVNKEPWGKGKYVVSSDVEIYDEIRVVNIQLNSGDICKIEYCYLESN